MNDFMMANEKELDQFNMDHTIERNSGIHDGLGCCNHALGFFEYAINYYDKALEMSPGNTEYLMHRAQCEYDQGNYDISIKDLEKAEKSSPENPKVLYKLGLSLYAFENYKLCVKKLKEALSFSPEMFYEADIYYHIGLAYCLQEKFEKAIYPFTMCSELIPSDFRYIHERAKAYQMIENHEKAVEDFTYVISKNPKNAHAHFRRAFSLKVLKKYSDAADDFEKAKKLDPLNPKMVVNYK